MSPLTVAPLSPSQARQERELKAFYMRKRWRESSDVYIDPDHGDDENDGLDEEAPIKTMGEARRRWEGLPQNAMGFMHGRFLLARPS